MSLDRCDLVLLTIAIVYIAVCPFTKVEESFNVQATHDLFYHRFALDHYDHFEFPGVVPRTFLGPVVLSLIATPFVYLQQCLEVPKLYTLYVIRIILAWITIASIGVFRRALVKRTHDKELGLVLTLLIACQFHIMFYCSRLLPNTFSLILCNLAHSAWLSNKSYLALCLFASNAVVFRSDCVVFAFPQLLMLLLRRKINIRSSLVVGFASTIVSALITISVDSIFWRRLIWPELNVFAFNVIDNKSSEWGVHPFHAYITTFLPKALLAAYMFIPFGVLTSLPSFVVLKQSNFRLNLNPHAIDIALPAISSVILYSFLPHKEIRFLFPVLLPLNAVAAMGILCIYKSCKTKRIRSAFTLMSGVLMIASLMGSLLFLCASRFNYPGGWAFHEFHKHANRNVSVHIDNLAAISGVSRFGETDTGSVVYSKEEGLSNSDLERSGFDYLIHEHTVPGYEVIASVDGFSGFNFRSIPPRIMLSPKLFILKRISASNPQ